MRFVFSLLVENVIPKADICVGRTQSNRAVRQIAEIANKARLLRRVSSLRGSFTIALAGWAAVIGSGIQNDKPVSLLCGGG